MKADLHTHTRASDGTLAPQELLARAAAQGVSLLAITDHDTVAGLHGLDTSAYPDLRVIPGAEFSTRWARIGIHVLGLNLRLDSPQLRAGLAQQRAARDERAVVIARRLAQRGLHNVLEGARAMAGEAAIGRPHVADYLVASGQVRDRETAFRRYLGPGKPGDVRQTWASLDEVISWIAAAGGQAVLAHPGKYRLSNLKLEELVRDFAAQGGHGLEVVCGRQEAALTRRLSKLAARHGLLASCGSDFHSAGPYRPDLGDIEPLPASSRPVWNLW